MTEKLRVVEYTCNDCVWHLKDGDESCLRDPKPIYRKGAWRACCKIKVKT